MEKLRQASATVVLIAVKSSLFISLLVFFAILVPSRQALGQQVVVSSYLNAADPRDEWSEILIIQDDVDLRNWTFRDNSSDQDNWSTEITFANNSLWNHLRAGTIIIIWHRQFPSSSSTIKNPMDINPADGYLEVHANDPTYFTGGNFGSAPGFSGETLNIAGGGDLLELRNPTGTHIHALCHKTAVGSDYTSLPSPKLNHNESLAANEAVFVCPGTNISEYGTLLPQNGDVYTDKAASPSITKGLPNTCAAGATANSDFWRLTRQPLWAGPLLNAIPNGSSTQVNLTWNSCTDPYTADNFTGYLVLRSTSGVFTDPVDGTSYTNGNSIGSSTVIGVLSSSATTSLTDNYALDCGETVYYRIYAFRYSDDNVNGNAYNTARGRAYNQTNFASATATGPTGPSAPAITSQNVVGNTQDVCTGFQYVYTVNPINPSSTYNWVISGGGSIQGPSAGSTINVNWQTSGNYTLTVTETTATGCIGAPGVLNVIVNTSAVASVNLITPATQVCENIQLTFSATPVGGGTTPQYTWYVNDIPVPNSNSSVFTYSSPSSYTIFVSLASSSPCASPNPVNSASVAIAVIPSVLPFVSIDADANTVCNGTPVTVSVDDYNNAGSAPLYQWLVNGLPVGGNSQTYTSTFNNADVVVCQLTSSALCANPLTVPSNQITITVKPTPVISGQNTTNPSICGGSDGKIELLGLQPAVSYLVDYMFNGTAATRYLTADASGVLTLSGLSAGNYSSIHVTYNGCVSNSVLVNLVDPGTTPAPVLSSDLSLVCPGEAVKISASNCSGLLTWSSGGNGSEITVNPLTTTSYTATCSVGGCTSAPSAPVLVTVKTLPVISSFVVSPPTTYCVSDGIITLEGLLPNTTYAALYTFNSVQVTYSGGTNAAGELDIIGLAPGNYFNIHLLEQGCRSDSIDVIVPASVYPMSPVIAVSTDTVCMGQMVTLTATGCSGTVEWSDGFVGASHTIPVNSTVTYTANCTENLCSSINSAPIQIVVEQQDITSITGTGKVCEKGTITLQSAGTAVSFEWRLPDGSLLNTPNVMVPDASLANTGYYTLTTTNSDGCKDADSMRVEVFQPREVTIISSGNLCAGIPQQLSVGEGFTDFMWSTGSTSQSITAEVEGIYWVSVQDSGSCLISDTVSLVRCAEDIYLPNAFSPDGDGINETFVPVTGSIVFTDYKMLIFNRWGQKIFESSNPQIGWDGKLNGSALTPGAYAYYLSLRIIENNTASEGRMFVRRGYVMLVK